MAISTGTFVSWNSSGGTARGKVTSIVKSGSVPGIDVKITGTEAEPAAKIEVYRPSGDGWRPSGTYVGHKVSSLKEIEPLKAPKKVQAASLLAAQAVQIQSELICLQLACATTTEERSGTPPSPTLGGLDERLARNDR